MADGPRTWEALADRLWSWQWSWQCGDPASGAPLYPWALVDELRAAGWKSPADVAALRDLLRRALPTLRVSAEDGDETDAALVRAITAALWEPR